MGEEMTRRLWRQARSNSFLVSLAGRTATLPITTFLPPLSAFFGEVDIFEGCRALSVTCQKSVGMKGNSFLPLIDDF